MNRIQSKWLVAIAFVAGFFMDLMDTTIINVAIPALAKELHAPDTTLEWVVTGYLLSLAIWIPASGWLGDRFGTKKTFLFALAMFTAGSALCSLAPDAELLIFFRVVQGVGGGMMTPVGTAMLFRAFPPEERAQASAILAIPAAAAPAIGPVLGGWLVDYVGWRWVFLVNVPVGVANILFCLKYLQEYKEKEPGTFDLTGFLLSGIGLALVLYALSTVPTQGIGSVPVIASAAIGVALLLILVWVESRRSNPILHFSLFEERLFRTSNEIMFFAFAMWLGFLFVLPLFLQQLGGLSAFQTGLVLSPQAIGWVVMSPIASHWYKRLGPRIMITSGIAGATLMTLVFALIGPNANLGIIASILFIRGLSMAFALIPIQAAMFTNISGRETGRASALFNTNRQVAASFGVALLGTVLFELLGQQAHTYADRLSAYHIAFAVGTGMGLIAIVFAMMIRNEDAEASLQPSGKGQKKSSRFAESSTRA